MTAKTKNIVTWALAGLLALGFAGAGISKLMGAADQVKNFDNWGYPQWMRYPIGLGELMLVAALLIPAYRKLALYGIFAWAPVAIYTHIQAAIPEYQLIAGPVVFLVLALALFYVSRLQPKAA